MKPCSEQVVPVFFPVFKNKMAKYISRTASTLKKQIQTDFFQFISFRIVINKAAIY